MLFKILIFYSIKLLSFYECCPKQTGTDFFIYVEGKGRGLVGPQLFRS